jgi:hypothetical protein
MSTDGYLHGTRRWAFFVALLSLDPSQKFVLKEPPQLSFSLAQRVRRNIPESGPNDQGAAVHSKNLRSLFSVQEMICHGFCSETATSRGHSLNLVQTRLVI